MTMTLRQRFLKGLLSLSAVEFDHYCCQRLCRDVLREVWMRQAAGIWRVANFEARQALFDRCSHRDRFLLNTLANITGPASMQTRQPILS